MPAGAVGGGATLGDDAFDAEAADVVHQRLPLGLDVLGVADDARRGEKPSQQGLALGQGQRPHVVVVEGEQVECVERDRMLASCGLDVEPSPQEPALLQSPEVRPCVIVEDHDFAVDHKATKGEGFERPANLGEGGRGFLAAAIAQDHTVIALAAQQAVPVVLQLIDPRGVIERVVPRHGQHRQDGARIDGATSCVPDDGVSNLPRPVLPSGELLDGEPGEDRARVEL